VGSQINVQLNRDGSNVTAVGINTAAVHLQYYKGGYDQGHASATKAGNTYTITGNITGGGLNGALKPFELDVTCP
jgi:ipoprotein LpqH